LIALVVLVVAIVLAIGWVVRRRHRLGVIEHRLADLERYRTI